MTKNAWVTIKNLRIISTNLMGIWFVYFCYLLCIFSGINWAPFGFILCIFVCVFSLHVLGTIWVLVGSRGVSFGYGLCIFCVPVEYHLSTFWVLFGFLLCIFCDYLWYLLIFFGYLLVCFGYFLGISCVFVGYLLVIFLCIFW